MLPNFPQHTMSTGNIVLGSHAAPNLCILCRREHMTEECIDSGCHVEVWEGHHQIVLIKAQEVFIRGSNKLKWLGASLEAFHNSSGIHISAGFGDLCCMQLYAFRDSNTRHLRRLGDDFFQGGSA